ncbi:MAG TPA: hypothetical protein VEK78_11975 [Gemmatimonadales bacterium]|nr:hypothetical protein [Gemmatimonadales bacterium]
MTWWDVLALVGVTGFALGVAGCATLLRVLPWGKDWNVGSYD